MVLQYKVNYFCLRYKWNGYMTYIDSRQKKARKFRQQGYNPDFLGSVL